MKRIFSDKKIMWVVSGCIFFLLVCSFMVFIEWPKISDPAFHHYDEHINSVVAANLVRLPFPPMVRINPLIHEQTTWIDGPYWQHIPPLFMYITVPSFTLFGISILVLRLTFLWIAIMTGILFIGSIYAFSKSLRALIAATIASSFWIITPFTRDVISGFAFNHSDTLLAFTIITSFAGILWYLYYPYEVRKNYSYKKLITISILVALPIIAKSSLGAIPCATYFFLYLSDHKKLDRKLLAILLTLVGILCAAYIPLYISNPAIFKDEILVPLYHFSNYENLGAPWYAYITDILPDAYLQYFAVFAYIGFIAGLCLLLRKDLSRKTKTLLHLSSIWFVWNLLVVSFIQTKADNFIYQTYLLFLFFIIYSFILLIPHKNLKTWTIGGITAVVCTIFIFYTFTYSGIIYVPQQYNSLSRRYTELARTLHNQGMNSDDLVILSVSDSDAFNKFYILFYTGAETVEFITYYFDHPTPAYLAKKYRNVYVITPSSIKDLDLNIPHTTSTIDSFTIRKFDPKTMPTTFEHDMRDMLIKHKIYFP